MPFIPPIILGGNPNDDLSDRVSSMEVSLTLDQVSQVTISVTDRNLEMLRANYFQIRQPVTYLNNNFEVASLAVSRAAGGIETVTMELRPAAIQAMKRNKGRNIFKGGSATAFASEKAREVGLSFFGENAQPKDNISQNSNEQVDESVWDVMKRVASDNSFICFEIDNRLFFCSEPFLLGKFGVVGYGENAGFISVPVVWNARPFETSAIQARPPIPGPPERPPLQRGSTGRSVKYLQEVLAQRAGQTILDEPGYYGISTETAVGNLQAFLNIGEFGRVGNLTWNVVDVLASGIQSVIPDGGFYYITPLGVPNCRKSDDATVAADMSFTVEREQGKLLRPGMTVRIDNVPGFEGHYLVTDVSWLEGSNEPVSVSGRTLVEPQPTADGKNEELNRFRAALSWTGGGFANNVIGVPIWSTTG